MNKYTIFKISKMIPPLPPDADYDINGELTLSQFLGEIKKLTGSQVHIVCKIGVRPRLPFFILSFSMK